MLTKENNIIPKWYAIIPLRVIGRNMHTGKSIIHINGGKIALLITTSDGFVEILNKLKRILNTPQYYVAG
jgi:hypothetical protein